MVYSLDGIAGGTYWEDSQSNRKFDNNNYESNHSFGHIPTKWFVHMKLPKRSKHEILYTPKHTPDHN